MKDHDLLLSVEGIDQTGKTQIVDAIERTLHGRRLPVHTVHDPPELDPWIFAQETWLDRENEMSPVGEAFVFLAARLDGVQRIIAPTLAEEHFVIADRYVDSWVAYHAPRLAGPLGSLVHAVAFLTELHERLSDAGLLPFPRRTWLIKDEPEEALRRKRGKPTKWENHEAQARVAETYDLLAAHEPRRFRVVDARGRDLDDVQDAIAAEVLDYCVRAVDTF